MRKSTVLLASLTAILHYGCGGDHTPPKTEATSAPPIPVSVVATQQQELPSIYEAPGTVRARTSSTLASKVMGYIREVRVQTGDSVKSGQILVVIDSRDLESGLEQARAAEQEARSGIAEADNGIAAAQAQLTLAKSTFKRMEDLFQKKSISDQEFDEAQARLKMAEANHQMALSRRAQLNAKIAQAAQGVKSADVMRSHAEIRAPFAGIVTEKRAEQGQMAAPGTPLLTIEQSSGFRLEAPVDESMIGSIRRGQNVTIVFDASDRTMNGRIDEIVPTIDSTSRAFTVKATLPAEPGIRSGVYGRLRIAGGSHQALVVPAGALVDRGDMQSIFVVENGIARARMVTVGQRMDGQAEILSGLQPGESIVHPRPAALTDGARVEVRR